MLEVNDIVYRFPEAIIRANFSVAPSSSLALMGPSGSGKSTILNLIAGFMSPQRGAILFDGNNLAGIKPSDRPLTYLFQAHNLFPHLSVWQNIAIGLHPGIQLTGEQETAVRRALEWVSLQDYAERKPQSLSGGQQQRVALARCLARNRPLLMLDEPFTGLDESLRAELLLLISQLKKDRSLTLLLTSHRKDDAEALGAVIYSL